MEMAKIENRLGELKLEGFDRNQLATLAQIIRDSIEFSEEIAEFQKVMGITKEANADLKPTGGIFWVVLTQHRESNRENLDKLQKLPDFQEKTLYLDFKLVGVLHPAIGLSICIKRGSFRKNHFSGYIRLKRNGNYAAKSDKLFNNVRKRLTEGIYERFGIKLNPEDIDYSF